MSRFLASEEFSQALKLGLKECKEASALGKHPHPLVLDEILQDSMAETVVDVGLVEIPAERIVGVKASGRVTAFQPVSALYWMPKVSLEQNGSACVRLIWARRVLQTRSNATNIWAISMFRKETNVSVCCVTLKLPEYRAM